MVFSLLSPGVAVEACGRDTIHRRSSRPLAIVVTSVVNPVFEEFLWLGYGVARLADRIGLRAAAVLSILLRLGVHTYQGPWAVLGVLPLALAFTWYYGRIRRLWPVNVAHVLLDALGLARRLAAGP